MMLVWTDTYFGCPWERESQLAAKGCKRLRGGKKLPRSRSGQERHGTTTRDSVVTRLLRTRFFGSRGSVEPVSRQAPLRR